MYVHVIFLALAITSMCAQDEMPYHALHVAQERNSMKETILVIGGAGYIGSHTAFLLAQQGYHVVVLDLLLHGQQFNHDWATFIYGDFGDSELLATIFSTYNITAVMHLAAHIEVGESVQNPLKYYENNVGKTINLLKSMIEHHVKQIIFSSSCAIYGNPQQIPMPEHHPKHPISPYGSTKLMIETMLHDLHAAGQINYVCLRYFNAAGALPEHGLHECHSPETHLIPLLIHAAQHATPFYLFGVHHETLDGSCVRDYLHVLDIARAHICALNHLQEGNPSDCFNLGSEQGVSVKQMILLVEKTMNTTINIVVKPNRPGDPAQLIADASRAHDILQWKPRYSQINFIVQSACAGLTQSAKPLHPEQSLS